MIARIILLVALIGSAAIVLYGLFLGRTQTIALTVAGLVVLAVTACVISVGLAIAAIGAGREGRGLKALGEAFLGGLFALTVAGALAVAVILGLLGVQ